MDVADVREEVICKMEEEDLMPTVSKMEPVAAELPSEQHLLSQGNYMYLSKVPSEQTTAEGSQQLVYLTGSNQQKILGITPVLLLANNGQKGTMEANVMLENTHPAFVRLSGQLQAMAQANLIAQTQEHIAQQLGDGDVTKVDVSGNAELMEGSESRCKSGDDSGDDMASGKDSGVKVYMCEKEGCGKMFVYAGSRKFHQASQGHYTSPKMYECPYSDCGRKFSRPAHFKYHQLTHTNNRQFACEVTGCDKRFFTAQRLRVHMRKHTGEKPFLCGDCGKCFTTAGNLKNHERIHTGERPYACDFEGCTKRFSECSSLKKHKLVHTGEKPFVCNICFKSFSQSGSRMVHMKRHEMASAASAAVSLRRKRSEIVVPAEGMVKHDGDKFLSKRVTIMSLNKATPNFQENPVEVSGVLTPGLKDIHVTSQPSDINTGDLSANVLESGGLDSDSLTTDTSSKAVSVVVLSQPQEIVGLTSPYHQSHIPGHEEIIYETDLLHTDLDHEEIAHSEFSLQSLTQGPQSSGDMGDGESIMVTDQGLTEHGDISSSTQTGREMAMDPMMESDDDSDHIDESKDRSENV